MLLIKFKQHHETYLNEWMRAEEVLKLVERIRVEVFLPSIMELRYASRRIVQAHVEYNSGNASDDSLEKHFIEAIENCKKARHDAIDAAITFIHVQYNKLCDAVGLALLSKGFIKFAELRREMQNIDIYIVESRKNRNGLDDNYESITRNHLKKVVDLYVEMETSKDVIEAIRKKERCDFWISVVAASAVICVLGGAVVTIADKIGVFDWAKTKSTASSEHKEKTNTELTPSPTAKSTEQK